MDKRLLHEKYESIEVPEEEVLMAIKGGVRKAKQDKRQIGYNRNFRKVMLSTAAAAVIGFSFAYPTASQALAAVPLVGQIYEQFNDLVGRNLAEQNQIIPLHETISHNGLDVTVTSAYFDGSKIGVTFNMVGEKLKGDDVSALYEIYNGKTDITETMELVRLHKTGNGYEGLIQVSYHGEQNPAENTLPLTFMRIGEQEGIWKFNVPLTHLGHSLILVNETSKNAAADVTISIDSVSLGQASSTIDYSAILPAVSANDQVRLELTDDKGQEIPVSSGGIQVSSTESEGYLLREERSIIDWNLAEKTDFVTIRPTVALFEKDQFLPLDTQMPAEIQSARQEIGVSIQNISVSDQTVEMKFKVHAPAGEDADFVNLFENFARNNVSLVEKARKDVYEEALPHSVKVLNKDEYSFNSSFDISGIEEFSPDKYTVRVSLDGLSSNLPVKLAPIKVQVDKSSISKALISTLQL